ncbi:hypothetical protein BDF19DRAFT_426216 [Syncephalis fuscata]|nr:hypothetical protein BDF19DRAFT_426216 [Syncephalis fuscata]
MTTNALESSKNPAVLRFLAEVAQARKEAVISRSSSTTTANPSIVIQSIEKPDNNTACLIDNTERSPGIYRQNGQLPPTPIRPSSKECCGSRCRPCIFDTFRETQKQHKQLVERIHTLHALIKSHTIDKDANLVDIEDIVTKEDGDVIIINH